MDLIIFLIIVGPVVAWMAWRKWGGLKVNPITYIKAWWETFAMRNLPKPTTDQIAPTLGVQTSPTVRTSFVGDVGPELFSPRLNQGLKMTNAELFNESGIRLTQMDKLLAEATARNKDAAVQVPLSAAHKLVGENGKALADLYTQVMTTPIVIPPVVPVPVLPTSGYTLTPDEVHAGILWGPAFGDFGAKGSGEKFRSHEERAEYVRQVLHQGEPGVQNPITGAMQFDPHSLTEDDWQFYVRHPEKWGMVQAGLYTNQQINAHQQGSSSGGYNPNWDESLYRGKLR